MGLFTRRKSRATRRAEARAIKAKAKLEARLAAKNEARRIKADGKRQSAAIKAGLKSRRDSDKAAIKVAETQLKAAREGKLLSVSRIRRTLTVSRLLAPVMVPIVYRAAMAARGIIDQRKADRLGVPLSQLGQFSGAGVGCPHESPGPSSRSVRSPRPSPRTPRRSNSWPRSTIGSSSSRRR